MGLNLGIRMDILELIDASKENVPLTEKNTESAFSRNSSAEVLQCASEPQSSCQSGFERLRTSGVSSTATSQQHASRHSHSLINPRPSTIIGAARVPAGEPSCSRQSAPLSVTNSVELNASDRVNQILSEASKNLISNFDILEILPKYRGGQQIKDVISKDGIVTGAAQKTLSRILVTYIRENPIPNMSQVDMREEMAITLVLRFPKFRKPRLLKRTDMPWHHWFNAAQNTGLLENANVGCQRFEKKLTGKGNRRSKRTPKEPRNLVQLPNDSDEEEIEDPDPLEYITTIAEARNMTATPGDRINIMNLMRESFTRRRVHMQFKKLSTCAILRQFPHFMSYEGEVIEQEFQLMLPNATRRLLSSYELDFTPRILKIASLNPTKYESCQYYHNDVLKSLHILMKYLPVPRRSYQHEQNQPLHGVPSELVHLIPMGTDPKQEATKLRLQAKHYLQPYILAHGMPGVRLGQMYLVCDGEPFQLSRQCSVTKAVDLLFKSYWALYLHYPLGWKNVFRFLQVHFYDIPTENPRESDFSDAYTSIENTIL